MLFYVQQKKQLTSDNSLYVSCGLLSAINLCFTFGAKWLVHHLTLRQYGMKTRLPATTGVVVGDEASSLSRFNPYQAGLKAF